MSLFAILSPSQPAWKWVLKFRRGCVCVPLGHVKPEGVCFLSTPWGRDGWPCIIFFTAVFAQVGNNSVILEQQTQWYMFWGASIEHSESCNMWFSPTISQSMLPTNSSLGKRRGCLQITLEDEKYSHIYSANKAAIQVNKNKFRNQSLKVGRNLKDI